MPLQNYLIHYLVPGLEQPKEWHCLGNFDREQQIHGQVRGSDTKGAAMFDVGDYSFDMDNRQFILKISNLLKKIYHILR